MYKLSKILLRIVIIMLVSGFLGATLVRVAPGFGVDERELDSRLSHESMQAIRSSREIGKSLPAYYLEYLGGMVRGDWGYSNSLQQPVSVLVAQRLADTVKTVCIGLLFSWCAALTMVVAPHLIVTRYFELLSMLLTGALLCLPAAVVTLFFVVAHAPVRLVVGFIILPKIYRYTHDIVKQSAASPHVFAAWAKGAGRARILFHHVFPAAASRLLAVAGISITLAFGAAIPVEVVADLPGIGQLAWKAAFARDLELLVSLTLIVTFITLVSNSMAEVFRAGTPQEGA